MAHGLEYAMTTRRFARSLLYAGMIAIVVGLGRVHAQFIGHYYFHSWDRLPWNLGYALILCIAAYGFGLPDLDSARSRWSPAIAAAVTAAVAISAIQIVLGSLLLPRFVILTATVLAILWCRLCVEINARGRSASEDRILLVAAEAERAALALDLQGDLERAAVLVAYLPRESAATTDPRQKPIVDAVVRSRATLIVLDRDATTEHSVVEQAATLHESGLRVRTLSSFYDEWLGKLPLTELERMSLMFDVGELHRLRYGRLKRMCDVTCGLLGSLIVVAVLPVVLVGNLIANRGPLFYRQPRVGRASRTFQIMKFRTMVPSITSMDWTQEEDARVTPWGRVMRRSHLDELPQVFNILRGDQSLVGPRPEQPQYVADLRDKIAYYDLRHLVRPGLTGWAQVKYKYGASDLDAMEKLQYDFFYLRHQGLYLDARIIVRTIRTVVARRGR